MAISPAQTMTQIAGTSAGMPSVEKFGGGNTTGSISGKTPSVSHRRNLAKGYSEQQAFLEPSDITGAMRKQSNIMFEPVQIPGMNPTPSMTASQFDQGAFAGQRLPMMPMPATSREAIRHSPFSHSFRDVFVPKAPMFIPPAKESITVTAPPAPPKPTPAESGGGEAAPEAPSAPDPMGFGGTPAPGVGKGSRRGSPGPSRGLPSSAESAKGGGWGDDPEGEFGMGETGDGDGGKVICGELHRQGIMSDEIYQGDLDYQNKYVSNDTKRGYLLWARPVSKLMRRSKLMTKIAKPFAIAWAEEMAYRSNSIGRGNKLGALILFAIAPLCSIIGKVTGPRSKKALLPA